MCRSSQIISTLPSGCLSNLFLGKLTLTPVNANPPTASATFRVPITLSVFQRITNYGTITAPTGTPLNFGSIGVPTGPSVNKGTITNPTP